MTVPILSLDAASPVERAAPLTIAVLSDAAALAAIGPEWEALEARADPAALFQTHAQTLIWAQNYLDGDTELCIVLVREHGVLRLILPLFVARSLGVRIARVTGSPIAQYADLIAEPGLEDRHLHALLGALRGERIDQLGLDGVREGSLLHRFATTQGMAPTGARVAPYVDLTQYGDHDAFVRARSKGFGKKMRARRRQLEEQEGAVRFEVLEGGAPARTAMEGAVDLKREWLIQRGAMSTAFIDPLSHACLLDLAESAPGALVILMLVNGTIAAIRLGFEHRGTFFSYLSAYDEKLAAFSPGKLLMDFTLATVRARGARTVDLFPPGSENKSVWCDTQVPVADYVLPLSLKGRLHARLYRQRLRPFLRWSYYQLPNALRSALARRMIRA